MSSRSERIFIWFWSAALLAVMLVFAVHFWAAGGLTAGTPRAWYFVYMTGLVVLAAALAFRPRLAMALLLLALIEASLGLGSVALFKYHLIPKEVLLPANAPGRAFFSWHPLLQVQPDPTPPGQTSGQAAFINSARLRGKQRSTASLQNRTVVGVFGGSTTFDFSPDGQTWTEELERLLGEDRFAVLNHGRGGYSTAEHVVQTAFYERAFGVTPHCALYYVGWNDVRGSHMRRLDPGYAHYHLRSQIDGFKARRLDGPALAFSPLSKLVARLLVLAVDTARPVGDAEGTISGAPDPELETIFARNIDTISAINRQRGIRTVWIGQVMNPTLGDRGSAWARDETSPWVPLVPNKDLLALIARLNDILKQRAAALGDVYVDVDSGRFGADDFVDHGHFTPAGGRKFAQQLVRAVATACGGNR
jgi:hypothetical protein